MPLDYAKVSLVMNTRNTHKLHQMSDDDLIVHYAPFVREVVCKLVAKHRIPPYAGIDDLVSVGISAMVSLIRSGNIERGKNLDGYISMRARGAVLDYLRRLDPVGRVNRKLLRKVQRAEESAGAGASLQEKASLSNVSCRDYLRALEMAESPMELSLDSGEWAETGLHEMIPDRSARSPDESISMEEAAIRLASTLNQLTAVERMAIGNRFFASESDKMTSRQLKVTKSRVSQIVRSGLAKVREQYEAHE